MRLATALDYVSSYAPQDLTRFEKDLPRSWIERALSCTGTVTLRRRRLPAEQLVWLVVGMAMFRARPISELVGELDLAMPSATNPEVAPSAVVQARDRLGETPMAWLFAYSADKWAHEQAAKDRWRGLALYGLDGTTLRTADSDETRSHFGAQGAGSERGTSGYPLVRLVTLMALRSHLLAGATFGPYKRGELSYAEDLLPCIPRDSLLIVDRCYLAANVLVPFHQGEANRHWLTRGKSTSRYRVLERLGRKDELGEFDVSSQARKRNPALPATFVARVIHYQRRGFKPQTLVTSLTDSNKYPASELVALYHERWEIELGYDEVKTEMLENVPLRSRNVDRARQEIWGILIAYNLIRLEMVRVAAEAGVPANRISFVAVFRMICSEWWWCAGTSPGAIPRHLKNLRRKIKRFILPPRRSHRSYPRAVKVKMSNYARKRPCVATARTKRPR